MFTASLGVRAGVETLDGGATRGGYADVSVSTDLWIGRQRFGLYVAVGVAAEHTGRLRHARDQRDRPDVAGCLRSERRDHRTLRRVRLALRLPVTGTTLAGARLW